MKEMAELEPVVKAYEDYELARSRSSYRQDGGDYRDRQDGNYRDRQDGNYRDRQDGKTRRDRDGHKRRDNSARQN